MKLDSAAFKSITEESDALMPEAEPVIKLLPLAITSMAAVFADSMP